MANDVCTAFLAKIDDQVERLERLLSLVPADRLAWAPPIPGAFTMGVLLGHVLDCLAGFCAVLYAAYLRMLGREVGSRDLYHFSGT